MVLNGSKKLLKTGLRVALAVLFAGSVAAVVSVKAMAADAAPVVAPAAPAAEQAEKGDVNIGRMLFTGEKSFANGGPPCISCHSASVGELGGGTVGPNLTKVYADSTKNAWISEAWINGGVPLMGAIFGNKPITEDEVNNLRAFFQKQSKGEVAGTSTGAFVIIGLAGFIGILIIFNIIWAGRYSKRTGNTAHDALWRNYGGKGGR